MIRFARTALILLVAAISLPQKVTSGEGSQTATAQHSEIGKHEIDAIGAMPSFIPGAATVTRRIAIITGTRLMPACAEGIVGAMRLIGTCLR